MTITNTARIEASNPPKRRRFRFWIGCLTTLLVLPILLYYGYCWGVWGRHSLLLQYFFQCNCPPASEEWRYPKQVDVIIPACQNDDIVTILSPSGRYLYIREVNHEPASANFLDLQTMERIEVNNHPFSSFLTDDLWFVASGRENYIMDWRTGIQYPIQRFIYSRPDAQINGETNLNLLAESLRQAEYVFLTGTSSDTVIALTSDFRTHSEFNFLTNRFDIPDFDIEQFLRDNNIIYQTVLPDLLGEAVSPNGRFVARVDGIYLVETGQKIVEGYSSSRFYRSYSRKHFAVRGWASDGRGVIYSKFLNPCLIETSFFIFDDPACYYEVPQPVILLKVSGEYLMPSETP